MTVLSRGELTWRMVRTRAGAAALIAVVCAVLALGAAAVPAVAAHLRDQTLRGAVATLAPGSRDVVSTAAGVPALGPPCADAACEPLYADEASNALYGQLGAALRDLRAAQPEPLRGALGDPEFFTRGPTYALAGRNGHDSLNFVTMPAPQKVATLTAGAWPVAHAEVVEPGKPFTLTIEIALSTASARAVEWKVGEKRVLPALSVGSETSVVLVGTFDPAPRSDAFWYHVPSTVDPAVTYVDLAAYTEVAALAAPGTVDFGGITGTTLWYPFDSTDVQAASAGELVRQLRAFTSAAHPLPGTPDDATDASRVRSVTFRTSAVDTIDEAIGSGAALTSALVLAVSGAVGAAVAVLALALRVVARTRRPALALLATRGAGSRTLRGMLAWHGVAYGSVPAAVVGAGALAALAMTGEPPPVAATVAVAMVVVLPAAILALTPPPRAGLRGDRADAPPTRLARALRLLGELMTLALAAAATFALAAGPRVGEPGTSSGQGSGGALVTVLPVLWALVACIVALRILPLPMGLVHAAASRGRGLIAFLASARTLRDAAVGSLPVLALSLGVASAVSSGVLLGSVQQEVTRVAHAAVPADLSIARVTLDADTLARVRAVPGIAQVVPLSVRNSVTMVTDSGRTVVTVVTADTSSLRSVQDAAHPFVLPGVDLAVAAGTVADAPAPAVVSWRAGNARQAGDRVQLGRTLIEVAGISDAAMPPNVAPAWVLVDGSAAEEVLGEEPGIPTAAFARLDPGADSAAVAREVRALVGADAAPETTAGLAGAVPQPVVDTPAERVDALQSAPAAVVLRIALLGAAAGTALLSALAVALTLVLGSAARTRALAVLTAVGTPRRVAVQLAAGELVPSVVVAVVAGSVVGFALPAFVLARVDLRAFTGTAAPVPYVLDPLILTLVIGGFLVVAALATLVTALLARRTRAATVLRQAADE